MEVVFAWQGLRTTAPAGQIKQRQEGPLWTTSGDKPVFSTMLTGDLQPDASVVVLVMAAVENKFSCHLE